MTATLSNQATVICNHGHYITIEASDGKQYRCTYRRKLGLIVAGDQVHWQQTDDSGGDITQCLPRTSEFNRLDKNGQPKLLASNISQLVIVSAAQPEPDTLLIDSYLAAASNNTILLFNKTDLNTDNIKPLQTLYESIGYHTLQLSTKQMTGHQQLFNALKNECSILVGQSGVGKSSIINLLLPKENIRTQAISSTTGQGIHTTTNATLYHLPNGGDLIDSPGVRAFRFQPKSTNDILYGFKEFSNYIGQCHFHNCNHMQEKGCAIIDAVNTGAIKASRWTSYKTLIDEFEKQKNW